MPTDASAPRWPASLAGLIAAAVALGVAELVTGLSASTRSLVASVGDQVVDRSPGGVVKWAIEVFGTADKAVLLTSIVVVCLGLGALVGAASQRRAWAGPAALGAAAVAGAAAGVADPLSSDAGAVTAAVLAWASGSLTLWALLGVARTGGPLPVATRRPVAATATATAVSRGATGPRAAEPMPGLRTDDLDVPGTGRGDRRAFLAWTGAATAFAGVAALGGRSLAGRTSAEAARAEIVLPPAPSGAAVPGPGLTVDGVSPLITPTADFYRIDTALVLPQVGVDGWSLEVAGATPEPYSLTFDELLDMPMVEAPVTIACVSNEVGGDLVGTAVWQGVPLTAVLERAGLRAGEVPDDAAQLVGRSVDGFTVGFPTETALDGRVAMVAVGMNGEPLPVRHGFPARLVVAGLYGYVSATKWLSRLELTGWDDFDAYWIPRGWAKEAPVKTQSRIDVPRTGAGLVAGPVAVAGVAWAPTRGISQVEVQVDDGPWQEARLSDGANSDVWRQWAIDWDATPGEHRLRVRATDGEGETQTEERSRVAPDGATGWHTRTVQVS
ncbi:molybdopterin-dependent oxidoreductase [Rhabdothermincola salaria]|uniref:molybdopterin-dependent oxidoreductase n=1 Tax=Rhabdothermincola salaria TaxID=2903142 RepID=UPI001E626EE2|nr:molybdopterin-dependent oxidoreductase [Rhabdothermincola salaria]MCD9623762.1 molybdopterin-dependent oxidoreductase [Rhabdothermincola salaria]